MSFSLRCELLYLHAAAPSAATGYAPMDVIWFLALLLCVLGSLPLELLMLGVMR